MTLARRTPRGWTRYALDPVNLGPILKEAEPCLAEGPAVEAFGWRDASGSVRKIAIEFANAAIWTLTIGRDGQQVVEESISCRFELGRKATAA